MEMLNQYFNIEILDRNLTAKLHCKEKYQQEELTKEDILQYLNEQKIIHGIHEEMIDLLHTKTDSENFPLIIATGSPAQQGINGNITYQSNIEIVKIQDPNTNFRDIMRLPMVEKGERLAIISEPTEGTDGQDVYGRPIAAKPGKPCSVKVGNNVVYREKDQSFYAAETGQVIVSDREIKVEEVYEIHETLSMRSGNVTFNGSIVIHGNVPTGYTLKADADIKVFGIVEGATLMAGGSIFVTEGMAGLKKGILQAGKDVHIGYVNQGNITSEGSIRVENSILHSECVARDHLYVKNGNIIGGSTSTGKSVEAKNIGNRMNMKTSIMFGMNESIHKTENELLEQKKELDASLKKLMEIGDKLELEKDSLDAKKRVLMLRQRHSFVKTSEALQDIDTKLDQLYAAIGDEYEAVLKINGMLYENVLITFGKYKRNIHSPREHVKLLLLDKEITIRDLT